MRFSDLPLVNACLNGMSACLLLAGFIFIRRKNRRAHERCMRAALCCSGLFLVCYITYHSRAGTTRFVQPAGVRPYYLTLLFTHTVLAATIVPLVIITTRRALGSRFELHRKIARWTWPLWMYVSVTGVIIYLMLYQIYPQPRPAPAQPATTAEVSPLAR